MGRSAIAAEATLTGSCNRGDRFRLHVDEPDGVIVAFGNVYVSLAVEAQLMRGVELCGYGRPAIAGISLAPVPARTDIFLLRKSSRRRRWLPYSTQYIAPSGPMTIPNGLLSVACSASSPFAANP